MPYASTHAPQSSLDDDEAVEIAITKRTPVTVGGIDLVRIEFAGTYKGRPYHGAGHIKAGRVVVFRVEKSDTGSGVTRRMAPKIEQVLSAELAPMAIKSNMRTLTQAEQERLAADFPEVVRTAPTKAPEITASLSRVQRRAIRSAVRGRVIQFNWSTITVLRRLELVQDSTLQLTALGRAVAEELAH